MIKKFMTEFRKDRLKQIVFISGFLILFILILNYSRPVMIEFFSKSVLSVFESVIQPVLFFISIFGGIKLLILLVDFIKGYE